MFGNLANSLKQTAEEATGHLGQQAGHTGAGASATTAAHQPGLSELAKKIEGDVTTIRDEVHAGQYGQIATHATTLKGDLLQGVDEVTQEANKAGFHGADKELANLSHMLGGGK